jgi:hypothetical protein
MNVDNGGENTGRRKSLPNTGAAEDFHENSIVTERETTQDPQPMEITTMPVTMWPETRNFASVLYSSHEPASISRDPDSQSQIFNRDLNSSSPAEPNMIKGACSRLGISVETMQRQYVPI